MKLITVSFLILIFLGSLHTFGQTILINGQKSTGKLTWSDFTGPVDKNASFGAYTAYKFRTKMDNVKFVGDSAIINGFDVILELDSKNTWSKKEKRTDELLIHEQGHFNLGILCVNEIMANVKSARLTKANFGAALQKIINEASKKYNNMGLKYDKETDHSKNTEQQKIWNNFFKESLPQL